MKDRRSNWQIVVSWILIFAVWFGALPIYAQTKPDGRGVGVKVVSELPSKEKRWALIVGIDEYQNDVSTLKGLVNDAKALKNVLVNHAGFPENQIILLTTDSTEPDKRPTRENILGALSDLYSRVPADGLLLFSFSGHGISVGNQAFLIPSNGRFTKNPELLQDFSIDVSRIKRAIETMKVKQVLMLLDACRNEPGKGDVPNRLTDAYKNGFSFDVANSDVKAFATLYATSIGERAFEFYDKDTKQFRGYFSHAVEEALKGKTANEKGEVTLSRLIDYLETTVPKRVKYDKGETQIPMANYSETYKANQLILAVTNKPESNSLSPAQIVWNNSRGIAKRLLKYQNVEQFNEGFAEVSLGLNQHGLINKNGLEVIPPKYNILSFSEGLVLTAIEVPWQNTVIDKVGYINTEGLVVIPHKYNVAFTKPFSNGLAAVGEAYRDRNPNSELKFRCWYIDKNDSTVISPKYEFCSDFNNNIALVWRNDKLFLIDKTGKELKELNYDMVLSRAVGVEGLNIVALNGEFGFIDISGKEIVTPKYEEVKEFSEGLAAVKLNERWGFIDKTGKPAIPLIYESVNSFSENLASVELSGKYGFINKMGKIVISPKYDSAGFFDSGFTQVELNKRFGLVDKTGKLMTPIKYENVWCYAFWKEGIIGITLNGKKGFVDINGNEYFDF